MHLPLAALIVACEDHGGEGSDTDIPPVSGCGLTVSSGPTVADGGPRFLLSRAVSVSLTEPATVEVTATDALDERVAWVSPLATDHDLPLVGLHAEGSWTLEVHAVTEAGCTLDLDPVAFETGALPSPLPHLDILKSVPEKMQPGLTIVPLYANRDASYIALVDALGRIVWLYGDGVLSEKFTEIKQLENGHLLALNDLDIYDMGWMGILGRWRSGSSLATEGISVPLPSFHHDVLWTSRDTLVVLAKRTLVVDDFPYDYDDPSVRMDNVDVARDVVVEFSPTDGSILDEWDVTTLLDLERIGYESLTCPGTQEGCEWAHTNSVDEDVTHGRWILSARNQSAVFAVDQATKTVDWILGNHDNWHEPYAGLLLDRDDDDGFEWQYHQHAAKYDAATNRILAFDNGNFRASPWTGDPKMLEAESYSRIVEFTVDEAARTVSQNWDFRLTPDVFSYAMGDADWLPNGNVLADFALVQWVDGQPTNDYGRGDSTVRIVEFDPVTGEVIWDLDVWGDLADHPNEWQAYRAQRIPRPFAPE